LLSFFPSASCAPPAVCRQPCPPVLAGTSAPVCSSPAPGWSQFWRPRQPPPFPSQLAVDPHGIDVKTAANGQKVRPPPPPPGPALERRTGILRHSKLATLPSSPRACH
jgi:hypothetical protein